MNSVKLKRWNLIVIIPFLATFVTACASQNTTPIMAEKPSTSITKEELSSMTWQLVSIAQKGQTASTTLNSGPATNRYNFTFDKGRVGIRGGCNNLSGSYRLGADNSIVLGPMLSTKKACAGPLMRADNEILSYLSGITDYSINGRALTLITAFQQKLVLKGTPTAETKFGGKGVRKFIEIQNTNQGLQWREVKYTGNWVRIQDNAAWETVYPGIQGFIPENNRQYIVRVLEYIDPSTQEAVWVKDLITMNGIL